MFFILKTWRRVQTDSPPRKKLPLKSPALLGLKYRAYEIALNPKYDRYQKSLTSMAYKSFDKKTGQDQEREQ